MPLGTCVDDDWNQTIYQAYKKTAAQATGRGSLELQVSAMLESPAACLVLRQIAEHDYADWHE